MNRYPAYLETYQNGHLGRAMAKTYAMLEHCRLCPRKCGVNRLKNEKGFCKTGLKPIIYSCLLHRGEEPPVSGSNGSGTIFFSYCNMACAYCQNFEFSQQGGGREASCEELAGMMLRLQKLKAHNINLVTPTHILPQILQALNTAIAGGLNIPLVYNTSGYELPEVIKLLEGIVDIYLPDMRYADSEVSLKYSSAPDYPEYNRQAVKEMFRQVGLPEINQEGVIKKGLIIRHLVLPEGLSGSEEIMRFISEELSSESFIGLMSQYAPYHRAALFPEISRRLTRKEYSRAQSAMEKYALHNGWIQEAETLERMAGVNIKPGI